MLDYAISRNKRRKLTRRIFASWVASCFCHIIMLLMLIQFPQLLRGGMYHRFRVLSSIEDMLAPRDDTKWRTVAVLRNPPPRLMAPSAATLRKYAYDWDSKGSDAPPVRVRWGDEQKAALNDDAAPRPRPAQQPPKPLPQVNDIADASPAQSSLAQPGSGNTASGYSPDVVQVDPNAKSTYLPPPAPDKKPKPELAGNNAPSSIPATKPGAGAADAQKNQSRSESPARIFENEQQALRSPEGGLFDTKGFPLGEYANLIIERIKGKWFIPSNLRNSQGHTTVVFFINKEGRFTDARIVLSSGSDSLDLAALNAVMASNPFPPLPKGFPGDHVGAKFIFSYNEPQ